MKIGFHFNAMHPMMTNKPYDYECETAIFRLLLQHRTITVQSKIFVGDLLLSLFASDITKSGKSTRYSFNPRKLVAIIKAWLEPNNPMWIELSYEKLQETLQSQSEIFVVCFETINMEAAIYIHSQLLDFLPYLGAVQVDDSSQMHWALYSNTLIPRYRILGKKLRLFWDGGPDGFKDTGRSRSLKKLTFNKVTFESLNGRYTIFDEYHNYDHARRVAEWKRRCGDLLGFIAEEVVHKLGDASPDLGDRLWATLQTFDAAETNEQLSQVAASCRRIVEYVSDQLFPPIEGTTDGYALGTKNYRNRLLAFADNQRRSDTDIDVIFISTKTLAEQIEKLTNLANKGTHAEVYRTETRRCLLRTIMLLDDIMSLKRDSFEIRAKLNYDDYIYDDEDDEEVD